MPVATTSTSLPTCAGQLPSASALLRAYGPSTPPSAGLGGSLDGNNGGAGGPACNGGGCGGSGTPGWTCLEGNLGDVPGPCNPAGVFSHVCGWCLAPDERVLLFPDGCKPAAEIVVGDRLLSADENGERSAETVVATWEQVQPVLRIVHERGELRCSPSHRLVLPDGSDKAVADLAPGDFVRGDDGAPVGISAVLPSGFSVVYGWTCEPSHTFVCGGLVHHNKESAVVFPGGLQNL